MSNLGMSFTHVYNPQSLVFLDLELSHAEGLIVFKTHLRPSVGKSYLRFASCHHPKWKQNIPKSQFCRLRKNCTSDSDYIAQGQILKDKFKGYDFDLVQKAFVVCQTPTPKDRPTSLVTSSEIKWKLG